MVKTRAFPDCLKLPLFLLPCNETGCLQLRIMGVPNYRELLARIILKSHYVPPPAGRPMYDALYQGLQAIVDLAVGLQARVVDLLPSIQFAKDLLIAGRGKDHVTLLCGNCYRVILKGGQFIRQRESELQSQPF